MLVVLVFCFFSPESNFNNSLSDFHLIPKICSGWKLSVELTYHLKVIIKEKPEMIKDPRLLLKIKYKGQRCLIFHIFQV